MAATAPDDCAVSAVSVFELFTGVEKCANPQTERAKVEQFLFLVHVLPLDDPAARQAAKVRATLEANGTPIGPYDVLLAGQALSSGLIVVTANVSEFGRVPGLSLENREV
jgi:tRNA(fMet)-specific endonuclease VapC